MIAGETLQFIQQLLEQNGSFAVYRMPGEDRLRYVGQGSGSVSVFNDIHALNGENGFVIAPFHLSADCPVVLIRGEEKALPGSVWMTGDEQTVAHTVEPVSSAYQERFHRFLRPLLDHSLNKLVLSREKTRHRVSSFSPVDAFLQACRRYIRSYVYLCHTPQTGTWLGATPEILLSGSEGDWHTMALAGTQPLCRGELPTSWNEKNREEQQLVAGYIRDRLAYMNVCVKEEGPYTVRAGELAHLRSDFTFTLPDNGHLGDLLELLHPTPAVCGLPKAVAYRFILDNEGYDRRYYSGFIGRLEPREESHLYVNLRCMHVGDEVLTLYAGGGLLASSVLDDEWRETEDKMQTMNRII